MTGNIYCIIGATGFLGRHLVQRLTTEGVRSIRCLSRHRQVPGLPIDWIVGNLHDERSLQNLIVRDAIVVNFAFDAAVTHAQNVLSARLLGQACVAARAQRLLHVSTAAVAGRAVGDTIDESTACKPRSRYERTKLDLELALSAETDGKLCSTIIRPTAVFGRGGRNLVKLARQTVAGYPLQRQIMAYFHGRRQLNLVAIENVVAAVTHMAAVPAEHARGVFVISDDCSENNNYAYVESRLARAFGKLLPASTGHSLPTPMLSLLLRLCGRSNVNPRRRYSCAKILGTGFSHPVAFEIALDAYTAFLADEWTRAKLLNDKCAS
jgi:nucleoside-diphosphate-sugar epimerase